MNLHQFKLETIQAILWMKLKFKSIEIKIKKMSN